METKTVSYTVNGQTKTRTETRYHNDKAVIIRRVVNLIGQKVTLVPGMYVYPFKFKLDDNVPGSISYGSGSNSGKIVYKVKTEVVRPGIFISNIKHTQIIQVCERVSGPITSLQAMKEANVSRFCCVDMGELVCSAILDKSAYSPGEEAKLVIAVDNTASDITLKHVSFKLVNKIHLRARSYTQDFRVSTCKNRAPGIPKGDTAHIDFTLKIPSNLDPSTSGTLVRSNYDFEVVFSVPWGSDIVVNLPVKIFAPVPTNYIENMEYPSDVPPQYQETVDIQPEMFQKY